MVRGRHQINDSFSSKIGVFQGDNLSPNLFNIFINDITKAFDSSCTPVSIGARSINSLLYADDLLLLSESSEGLQNCMNKVYEYCSRWGLDINYQKSKVIVFNKGSRISNSKCYIKDTEIKSVRVYKYLGVLFNINGSFTNALNDMFCRGQKAFFKLTSIFKNMPC